MPYHPPYKAPYSNFQWKTGPLGGPRPMTRDKARRRLVEGPPPEAVAQPEDGRAPPPGVFVRPKKAKHMTLAKNRSVEAPAATPSLRGSD